MQRLWRFLQRAEKVGIDAAARSAFGQGFFELEAEWEAMLKNTRALVRTRRVQKHKRTQDPCAALARSQTQTLSC